MERILCLTRVPSLVLSPERIILQFSKGLVDVSGGLHVPATPNHSAETEAKAGAATTTGPIGQCVDYLEIRIPFVKNIHVLHDLIDQATHTRLETYSEPED